jgi:hypothetical protein
MEHQAIALLGRRHGRRVAAPPTLRIAFQHPLLPALSFDARVLDLSSRGLYFRTQQLDHLLYPGLSVPQLSLFGEGVARGNYRGHIRSVRFEDGDRSAVIGLSLEPAGEEDAVRLRVLVDPVLYPSTLGSAQDVWNVFETSGYLNLSGKAPADFDRLRANFSRVALAIERAPNVGALAHWPAQGKIQATLSHLKMYQHSWLLCQVSKLKGEGADASGRHGLRDMYLRIYESAHADADTRFLLVYVQDEAPRWSRELHVELPRRYVQKGEACLVPFRALEVNVQARGVAEVREDMRVEVAQGAAAADVARDLAKLRPAQYLQALDLCEARMDLAAARARWSAAGLERERQVFVAYEDGERLGAAVLETAAEGAHLYGLLDCLRMYPLRTGGERSFRALLSAAHAWFAARGRQQFTYLEEYPNTLPLAELGFRDLGGATFSILAVERTPELLQRAAELASRRRSVVTAVAASRDASRV